MPSETSHHAWPYREARRILEKLEGQEAGRSRVILETGFGPSGLPHIGTFGEVARTEYVRLALGELSPQTEAVIYAFSDDMDGMRGIPANVPDQEALKPYLGMSLCDVPDPFGEHESFAGHMNQKLQSFLDSFGFAYEFKSSRDQYRQGIFDKGLEEIVDHYDEIRDLVAATLGPENRESWSPFLPRCEQCNRINTTSVTGLDRQRYTVSYTCDKRLNAKLEQPEGKPLRWSVDGCGHQGEVSVHGGRVKVGWKVDWALRWHVLGVDYEMYGKDLIDSAVVSKQIVGILGGQPPVDMVYEWFNDEKGQSISKTKGNGLSIEQWLTYGPIESLSWYIWQNPSKAKKLFFGIIPQSVDRFLKDRQSFGETEDPNNPVWFVEADRLAKGLPVGYQSDITYSVLTNLVSVLNTDDRQIVWDYVLRYDPEAGQNEEILDRMIDTALHYYRDFIAPTKVYSWPQETYHEALDAFVTYLQEHPEAGADELQSACYSAAKDRELGLGGWFKAMYQLLLGQDQGPRIGTFVSLYGIKETLKLIEARREALGQGAGSGGGGE